MAGETAVDGNAEEAVLQAEILIAVAAVAALAAADPGKNRLAGTDQILRRFRAYLLDDTGDLVSERERQRHAAGGVEPFAAAEIGIAVLDVQVGMAKSAALDAHQHLRALRLRR